MKNKVITIIDTFGFLFRSYWALPQFLKTKDGFPTGLITGFLNFISNLERKHDSDYIVFAIDSKGDTFRKTELDNNYKANRAEVPQDLLKQLPVAIELINKMGYKTLGEEGFEADDIIATVAKLAKEQGINVRVVSHDKDLYQLIDDGRIVLVDPVKNSVIDEEYCKEKYGITPKQFIDYQALLGDSIDNVPGVKGIGKVTASKLLKEWGSLDEIYANIDKINPKGVRQKLIDGKESAYLSKKLVTLRDDVYETLDFEQFRMDIENPFLNIYDDLVRYEQNQILRMLEAKKLAPVTKENKQTNSGIKFEHILITDENHLNTILNKLSKDTLIAFDTETTGLNPYKDELVGFSFCFEDDKAYYVPLSHNYLGVSKQIDKSSAKDALKKIFSSRVIGHNIKFDLHFVTRFLETDELNIFADTIVLAWLSDPSQKLSLDTLAKKIFDHDMISFKETVAKGKDFSSVELEDAAKYAAEDAFVTYKLYFKLRDLTEIQNPDILKEFFDVEVPFVKTLLDMEQSGIKVDVSFLSEFKKDVEGKISKLTKEIYSVAKETFNINSTKQLGKVLFEDLGLTAKKKTKTGYSTDEKVLSELRDEHPIIPLLLEYREVYKLYSTYVEPLLKLSLENADRRVHTSFVQTGTTTGRLSSKDPNLQNIPVKTELGSNIRRAFVADEKKLLIGIDYSQIELRLLAHFSKDPVLMDAFRHDKDIHTQTATLLFGEENAKAKRAIAKTVNFGLLYGMGQKKLSDTLGISTKEAKEIIENYFKNFPTVKSYFNEVVEFSKQNGYVETLLKRRRYFDYENARPVVKAAYEREAVNTVFQGSASDLIKLSMNKIANIIKEENLKVKMLLQIHDELIFEADEEFAKDYGDRFKGIMENIYQLNIPLKCSLNIGKSWQELK